MQDRNHEQGPVKLAVHLVRGVVEILISKYFLWEGERYRFSGSVEASFLGSKRSLAWPAKERASQVSAALGPRGRWGFQRGAEKTYSKLDAKGTAALECFLARVEQMTFLLFTFPTVSCACAYLLGIVKEFSYG